MTTQSKWRRFLLPSLAAALIGLAAVWSAGCADEIPSAPQTAAVDDVEAGGGFEPIIATGYSGAVTNWLEGNVLYFAEPTGTGAVHTNVTTMVALQPNRFTLFSISCPAEAEIVISVIGLEGMPRTSPPELLVQIDDGPAQRFQATWTGSSTWSLAGQTDSTVAATLMGGGVLYEDLRSGQQVMVELNGLETETLIFRLDGVFATPVQANLDYCAQPSATAVAG